jgi:PKD repeat protein
MNLARAYLPILIAPLLMAGCAHLGIYRLSLRAEPLEGPAPLTVSFIGEITGGLDSSPELHCRTETWSFGDGTNIAVFGYCEAWRPGTKLDRHFQRTHTYEEPGIYEISVSYGSLKAEPILVKALE